MDGKLEGTANHTAIPRSSEAARLRHKRYWYLLLVLLLAPSPLSFFHSVKATGPVATASLSKLLKCKQLGRRAMTCELQRQFRSLLQVSCRSFSLALSHFLSLSLSPSLPPSLPLYLSLPPSLPPSPPSLVPSLLFHLCRVHRDQIFCFPSHPRKKISYSSLQVVTFHRLRGLYLRQALFPAQTKQRFKT